MRKLIAMYCVALAGCVAQTSGEATQKAAIDRGTAPSIYAYDMAESVRCYVLGSGYGISCIQLRPTSKDGGRDE